MASLNPLLSKNNKRKPDQNFTKFFERSARKYRDEIRAKTIGSTVFHYLLAIILSSSVVYGKYFFYSEFGKNPPLILLFISVLISGWLGGLGPAIVATFLSGFGALYFFYPSFIPFSLDNPNAVVLIAFMVEGVFAAIILETRLRNNKVLKSRVLQQAMIAQLGHHALTHQNLPKFLQKSAELITKTLQVKYCKILELLPGRKSFLLVAGEGWKSGLVGNSIITADQNSQGGYALLSNQPIIVKDLKQETRFYPPELLTSHGVVSGMSVIISGKRGPYGIVGVHSDKKRNFTEDDINFVQAITHIIASVIEKEASERAIRESESRFKRLFESNIIGTFVSTFDGKFLEANDALLSLIGYSRKDLKMGKVHRDILTPKEYAYTSKNAVKKLETKGSTDVYEKEYIAKSGKRIPILIAVSRIDKKKEICVGFVLDISRQKELETRKDEFISTASHELKTPITSLKVLTQFLQHKAMTIKPSDLGTHLEKMNKQVNKLTELVNSLLDVTQMQAGKLRLRKTLFNLNELVKEVIDEIQTTIHTHTIRLTTEVKVAVFADSDRMYQVIVNLLTNAIKYSPKNSEVLVSVAIKDNNALVSVKDFGSGIDKHYQKTIFEQFFRVSDDKKATFPGLGMGLFISKQIVERHMGKIWVESEKGKGAIFSFSLPLLDPIYEKSQ